MIVILLTVNALPSVHAPPTPLSVMSAAIDVPLVVMVLPVVVALNVIAPVDVHVVPVFKDMLPEIANVGDVPSANVQPVTDVVISKQVKAPVIVTVPAAPDPESKNTLSDAVGTDAPDAPPEDADQFVVEDVFHVPAPPTQYLFATVYSCGGLVTTAYQLSYRCCFRAANSSGVSALY